MEIVKKQTLSETFSVYLDRRMVRILLLGIISGFPWVLIGSSLSLWLKEDGLSRSTIGWAGLIFGVYAINYLFAKDVMPDYITPTGFILLRVFGASLIFFTIHSFFIKEKIVYQDWDELWGDAILFFKGENKNFGTWDNEIIDQIDKFRDNNSDKRIAYITQKVYDFHNSKKNQDLEKIIIDYRKFWKIYDQ